MKQLLICLLFFGSLSCQSRVPQTPTGSEKPTHHEDDVSTPHQLLSYEPTLTIEGANLLAPHPSNAVAFSPDGQWLISGGGRTEKGSLLLWDTATGDLAYELEGIHQQITSIAVASKANLVAAAGVEPLFALWALPTGSSPAYPLDTYPQNDSVYAIALSPDGASAVVGCADDTLSLWSLSEKTSTLLTSHAGFVQEIIMAPDGKHFAALLEHNHTQEIALWNLMTATQLWSKSSGDFRGLAFNTSDSLLVVEGDQLLTFSIVDGDSAAFTQTKLTIEPEEKIHELIIDGEG